jgi:hypothetical protein
MAVLIIVALIVWIAISFTILVKQQNPTLIYGKGVRVIVDNKSEYKIVTWLKNVKILLENNKLKKISYCIITGFIILFLIIVSIAVSLFLLPLLRHIENEWLGFAILFSIAVAFIYIYKLLNTFSKVVSNMS